MMRTQKGFTLIELVMVIVILGILAAVAIPKYLDLSTTATANAVAANQGAVRSAFAIAFASHRVAGLAASGATAGVDQFVTNCASAVAYLTPASWPANTSCADGPTTITWQIAPASMVTSETTTRPATF